MDYKYGAVPEEHKRALKHILDEFPNLVALSGGYRGVSVTIVCQVEQGEDVYRIFPRFIFMPDEPDATRNGDLTEEQIGIAQPILKEFPGMHTGIRVYDGKEYGVLTWDRRSTSSLDVEHFYLLIVTPDIFDDLEDPMGKSPVEVEETYYKRIGISVFVEKDMDETDAIESLIEAQRLALDHCAGWQDDDDEEWREREERLQKVHLRYPPKDGLSPEMNLSRLLSGIQSVGGLKPEMVNKLSGQLDMEINEVHELIDMAVEVWKDNYMEDL